MPLIGGRYMDADEYADARADALADEYYDRVEDRGWTCEDCGEMWDPGHTPGTRWDPPDVNRDYCPQCGGGPTLDAHGFAVEGREQ